MKEETKDILKEILYAAALLILGLGLVASFAMMLIGVIGLATT